MQEAGRDAGEVESRGHLSYLEPWIPLGLPAPTIPIPSSLRGNPHSWVTSDLWILEPDWALGPLFSPSDPLSFPGTRCPLSWGWCTP